MCPPSSPKVSVVLASYNQAPYLRQAIDSILGQAFDDYELIIVDDGSSDGSRELIEDIVARHPGRVRFCHHLNHRNLGISPTYLLGIGAARGAYVAFLEGDDRWGPNYLGGKVAALDRHPDVGVVFSRYRILSGGFYGCDMAFRQWILGLFTIPHRPFNNVGHLMMRNNVATFSAFVARKSLLDQSPLTLPREILFFDWWVLLQLGMRSKFLLDPASVVEWRQHPGSALGKQKLASHKAMLGRFMQVMYEEIGRNLNLLDERDQARYLKNNSLLPRFVRFYEQPGAGRFLAFFVRAPLWALTSLASYCVNHWKFSR
jgi:glycosyltransferase involved in cell wall biosynthesis